MKRLSAILLCVILVLSMAVTAYAEPVTHTITVNNGVADEEYNAYKLFDVTYQGVGGTDNREGAFAYTIKSTDPWFIAVTTSKDDPTSETAKDAKTTADGVIYAHGLKFTPIPGQTVTGDGGYITYTVEEIKTADGNADAFNAATFAAYLYTKLTDKTAAATITYGEESGQSKVLNVDTAGDGYYFVTTSLGALCGLDTTRPTATINEKNSEPGIEKKVKRETEADTAYADNTNVSIGDTVTFKITVTDGTGTDADMTVTDTWDEGLTFVADSITVTGVADYTTDVTKVADPDRKFTVSFDAGDVADGATVVITYKARLNSKAVVYDGTNTNNVVLAYSHQTYTDSATVDTFKFSVIKTDSANTKIDGAEFKLYDAQTGGKEIKLVKTNATTNTYRVIDRNNADYATTAGDTITAGMAIIEGLGNGTYWVEETKAPDGYNALSERVSVEITDDNNMGTVSAAATDNVNKDIGEGNVGGLVVVNNKGSILPFTGGIGTTIFYSLGALLVVGAVILLISKKRMKKNA